MLEEKLGLSEEPLETVQSYAKGPPKHLLNCDVCEQSFDSKKSLKKHLADQHPRKIQCKKCD